MRRALAAIVLTGCSWTLPAPHLAATDRPTGDDRVSDVVTLDATDAVTPMDRVSTDVVARPDVVTGTDVVTGPDVVTDVVTVVDARPADDIVDAGRDAGDVVDARDAPMGACTPGERRSCYTGPMTSRGVGVCRDGVQRCDETGQWAAACDGQIVPDCAGRACGTDDCGGSCGMCAGTLVCDDTGHCVTPACGMANFTVVCPDRTRCPANSACGAGGSCTCNPGFLARTCRNEACTGSCAYPDWYCAPAGFCGAGAQLCASGSRCPRHSTCNDTTGGCVCNAGYMAVDCAGDRCTTCPGIDYRCVPLR